MTLPREAIAVLNDLIQAEADGKPIVLTAKHVEVFEMSRDAILELNYVSVEVLEKLRRVA